MGWSCKFASLFVYFLYCLLLVVCVIIGSLFFIFCLSVCLFVCLFVWLFGKFVGVICVLVCWFVLVCSSLVVLFPFVQ